MGRSSFGSEAKDTFIGMVVFGLIIAFLVHSCDNDDPESRPSPRPAVSVTETPPDVPETEEDPAIPETGDEEDDSGSTSRQDSDGQVGIQFGYACSPVGSLGRADDGRPAKCFMGKDGRARWGYDSNRG
ncbi:hypothetical protein [Streptomyces erythrochromogenes]|uniref:hypothetical protein n=1 Tax=Streptomyces erythrochromogenes TaxID=285574 RepID=UPI0037000689